jgi:hypothetical protein
MSNRVIVNNTIPVNYNFSTFSSYRVTPNVKLENGKKYVFSYIFNPRFNTDKVVYFRGICFKPSDIVKFESITCSSSSNTSKATYGIGFAPNMQSKPVDIIIANRRPGKYTVPIENYTVHNNKFLCINMLTKDKNSPINERPNFKIQITVYS